MESEPGREHSADGGSAPRPILRGQHSPSEGGARGERRKIRFDEEAIKEHDKERGTRRKIEEPKTPFNREPFDVGDDEAESTGGGVNFADLQSRLQEAEREDSLPSAAKSTKKSEFEEKRKKHYNEMELLRKWREEHPDEDEDDEEENGEGNGVKMDESS